MQIKGMNRFPLRYRDIEMNRQTLAVTFAIVVSTIAGVVMNPKPALACADVGTCVPPSVLYPSFEVQTELECVEIDKNLVGSGEYEWEFEIHNNCTSNLYSSAPLFECSSQLEAGETAALSVPGNSLTTGTCTEPDDGTHDAGAGTADVGTIADTWGSDGDSGHTPVDAGPDGGKGSTVFHIYELYLDDVGYVLEYEYVEPDSYEVVEEWKEENCQRTRCTYVDVYPPGPETGPEEETDPDHDISEGTADRTDAATHSDAGTAWSPAGSDEAGSDGCSTSGSSTPAGSALLVALLALVGITRRRPFERTA